MTIFKTLLDKFPLAFFLAFTFPSTPALKDPINKSHDQSSGILVYYIFQRTHRATKKTLTISES